MRDYLGYDVDFVMNVTDIDDKIIVRARQAFLVRQMRENYPSLSAELLKFVQEAWRAYFASSLARFAPPAPPHEQEADPVAAENERSGEGGWEQVVRLSQDSEWRAQASTEAPKFSMWYNALVRSVLTRMIRVTRKSRQLWRLVLGTNRLNRLPRLLTRQRIFFQRTWTRLSVTLYLTRSYSAISLRFGSGHSSRT